MSKGRHGIKMLGLSLIAALSLMALTATAAQAGEYRVEGHTFTAHGIAQETVEGTIGAGHLLVPGLGLEIFCTGGTFSGTVFLAGAAHVTALYNGCEILGNKNCLVYETKMDDELFKNSGHIVILGSGEVILHTSKLHFLKLAGAPLGVFWFGNHEGKKLCTLPLETEVSGSVAFKLPTALTDLVNQTIEPLSAADKELLNLNTKKEGLNLGIGLFFGKEVATLDGGLVTDAHLTGALKGKTWGAE